MKPKGKTRRYQSDDNFTPLHGLSGLTRKPVTREDSSRVFSVVGQNQDSSPWPKLGHDNFRILILWDFGTAPDRRRFQIEGQIYI